MAHYWFSTYTGSNWTIDKGQFNELFALQVRMLREEFKLEKVRPGLDQGTDYWREYKIKGHTMYVWIGRLEWLNFKNGKMYFRVHFHMHYEGKVVLNEIFQIHFPESYPKSPPTFVMESSKYQNIGPSHDHHMLSNGVLCILSESQWSSRDTIVSGINVAFDHLFEHYRNYSW